MLLYSGMSVSNYSLKRLTGELLMVHSWFWTDLGLNYPAWSISAELFAYICVFPLAFLCLKRIRSVPMLGVTLILLLAGASFVPSNVILGRGGDIVFLFLAGSTLYRIRCLKETVRAEWIQNLGFVLVLGYVVFSGALPRVIIFAGFAALVFGLSYQRGFLSRVLSTRFVVAGGLASYSLYMTHAVVGKVYGLFTEGMAPQPVWIRLLFVIGLVMGVGGAAMGCYRFVEEPANRVLRRLVSKAKRESAEKTAEAVLEVSGLARAPR